MTLRAATVAALALAAGPMAARADCAPGETTILSCSARDGGKALDVCISGSAVTYAYGPADGPPELSLQRDVSKIEARPWNGIGRTLWEEVTFHNAGYTYLVFLSVDRLEPDALPEGGVIVQQGDKDLARVDCDAGSAALGFWAMSDAKALQGLCWDLAAQRWDPCE